MNTKKKVIILVFLSTSIYLLFLNIISYKLEIIGDNEASGQKDDIELKIFITVNNETELNKIRIRYVLTNIGNETITLKTSEYNFYSRLYNEYWPIRTLKPRDGVVLDIALLVFLKPGEKYTCSRKDEYEIKSLGRLYISGVWKYIVRREQEEIGYYRYIRIETSKIPIQVNFYFSFNRP